MSKPSFTDALASLQRRFLEQLPQRVEAIGAALLAASASSRDPAPMRKLVHLAHGLVGSAGTFGLAGLSESARRLELAALALLCDPAAAGETGWQQAREHFAEMQRCARQAAEPSPLLSGAAAAPAAAGGPPALQLLALSGPAPAAELAQHLQARGFHPQCFDDVGRLQAQRRSGGEPAAVLVDARALDDEAAALQELAALGLGSERGTPLLWLGAGTDAALVLQALRAGVDRYLTQPLDETRLFEALDQLAGRRPAQPYRVLLVDDDPLELAAHAALLGSAGMEVDALTEPMAMFAALQRGDIDVLLLDVGLPGASGAELAAVVRQYEAYLDLPILFLSAERDARQQLQALNLGGDDFLVKPVAADHLLAAVLARARRARQARQVRNRLQTLLYEREREHLAIEQHAIVSVTDAQGRITYVNDMFCQVSGFAREELIGQNHSLLKSGLHDDAFYGQLWRTISAGQVWQGELCNRRKDGRLYWVKSTITPFLDERGRPYQYVSIRTDVSRLMRHERALRQLVQASSVSGDQGFFAAVTQGIAQALDADVAFVVQCQPGQAAPQLMALWPGPAGSELLTAPAEGLPWAGALAGRTEAVCRGASARYPALQAFGAQAFESYLGLPLHDAQGRLLGHIGLLDAKPLADPDEARAFLQIFAARVGDEMQRLRAQAESRESEERLRSTLESTKDGILAIDDRRQVVFMNRQFRELWRIDPMPADAAGAQDEGLLQRVAEQLLDPAAFVERVREIYASEDEATDLLEFADGRVFERYSRRLHAAGKARVWSFHDVTERLRAEREAQLHKERLRRGQLFANIGTWEWDIRSGKLFWTERIGPLFGHPEGMLTTSYESFLASVHPEDKDAVIAAVRATVLQGAPYEIEHRVVWPDGTVRWLHERGAVERDDSGEPVRMLGVVMDIDERKRTALALAEREQQLLEAQQLARIGNWSADMVSGALQWSDEIYRIFGHEPGSIVPSVDVFIAAVHPDDVALVRASEEQARLSGQHDVVHRIVRPDGGVRHVHERARAETGADGRLLRMTGTVQDITELVEAEARLHETEARFATAVESTGDGIWDWDIASGAMPLAGHYEAMLGFAQGEIEPHIRAWADGVHPEDMPEVRRRLDEYMAGRSAAYSAEMRMRCKDGSYKWILCRGAAVRRDEQGRPLRMVGTHTDIGERKAIEASLRDAREAAERASRAKSDFLSSMSHELRTPLNAILGFAQLLEYGDELAAEQLDSVREILRAGRHLLELIDEVLDLARVESGSVKLTIEPVELDALVAESLTLMQPLAERRHVVVHPAAVELGAVLADRMRLKQVLLNLLSNALKYNREGGSVAIEPMPAEQGRLRLCVRDTGMGIDKAKLALLFQPFSRLDAELLGIEGTGIGLTITRQLIEMMGGSVGVHSEPGQGSCFWIDLPRAGMGDAGSAQSPGSGTVATGAVRAAAEADTQRRRVLYVEDNPANLRLVEQILALRPGLQLQTAELPSQGIELARLRPPDLVLLDINMPEMDGYQLLSRLRAEPQLAHVPMVAISADAMPNAVERGLEAGFDAYLTKPLNVEQFLSTLDSLMLPPVGDRQN